jgi:hypothetical protein
MALPALIKKLVEKKLGAYCEGKIPPHIRNQIRLIFKIRGDSVTLIEERPYYRDNSILTHNVVAQFRFNPNDQQWTLYCADRNSKWHLYSRSVPTKNIDTLLHWIEKDPTGIFWG